MKPDNNGVGLAIRRIEKIEDQLHDEGHELADVLSDARGDLVDELLQKEFEKADLRKQFARQVEEAPRGSTLILDEAQGEITVTKSDE